MIASISYLFLQQYWWALIALLGALLVFLMFVQGGQTLIYTIGKSADQRSMLINTLGRKWEFTFTTLVTFGGAFFASFPLFYSTSFGGAYWVWMAILFTFILQAVSYEFRSKPNNFLGKRTFEIFLILNGWLAPFLIGTAVGTFFNGAEFSLNEYKLVLWQTPWRGLEALVTFDNVALGLAVLFLVRLLGTQYILNSVDEEEINARSKKQLLVNAIPFLIFFLYFLLTLLLKDGYTFEKESLIVSIEKYKYLNNLIEMPLVMVVFLVGVVLVLFGLIYDWRIKPGKGIWFSGTGTILTVFALFLLAGYNQTCFYPSTYDLQSSLNIQNSSSSRFTLTIMSYVSFFIPIVAAYIWIAWKSINRKKIDQHELKGDSHLY